MHIPCGQAVTAFMDLQSCCASAVGMLADLLDKELQSLPVEEGVEKQRPSDIEQMLIIGRLAYALSDSSHHLRVILGKRTCLDQPCIVTGTHCLCIDLS